MNQTVDNNLRGVWPISCTTIPAYFAVAPCIFRLHPSRIIWYGHNGFPLWTELTYTALTGFPHPNPLPEVEGIVVLSPFSQGAARG